MDSEKKKHLLGTTDCSYFGVYGEISSYAHICIYFRWLSLKTPSKNATQLRRFISKAAEPVKQQKLQIFAMM